MKRSMNPLQFRRLELALRTAMEESGHPPPGYRERHAWVVSLARGQGRGVWIRTVKCSRCGYVWTWGGPGGLRSARSAESAAEFARLRRAIDRHLPWAC
jgi:hypothetical protein